MAQPEEVVLFSAKTGTVKLKDVERVCLGPEVPRKDGEGGLVDEYHLQVKPSHRARRGGIM